MKHLAAGAEFAAYVEQAEALRAGHAARDGQVLQWIGEYHPRYRDPKIAWLARAPGVEAIAEDPFTEADAGLTLASIYFFLDWDSLAAHVRDETQREFEAAVEAVIHGETEGLRRMLERNPELARGRSRRVNCFDPPVHRATLLHYLAANGVENYRQRTPKNAVEVAELLLDAGADPAATASLYGGECTVLSMLASSGPPAEAGVQLELAELLVKRGADPNEVRTALLFGFVEVAELLVRLGARVDTLPVAAGMGRESETRKLLAAAGELEKQQALALAAQLGRAGVVRILLEGGADPNRMNPEGFHGHATPLHHAALGGHLEAVRVLVDGGAKLDIRDTTWGSTPEGWAEHGGHPEVAAWIKHR
jgi:ankyrin repeat protein